MKYMTMGELQGMIANIDPKKKVRIAKDEEWNTLYERFDIDEDEKGNYVIYGLDGSQSEDQWG